jgi:hypothetical protein
MNQHTTPQTKTLSKEEFRQLVIEGKTTAGPLAVLLYKNPALFWTGLAFLTFPATLLMIWVMNQV